MRRYVYFRDIPGTAAAKGSFPKFHMKCKKIRAFCESEHVFFTYFRKKYAFQGLTNPGKCGIL